MFHTRNDLPLGARTKGAATATLAQVARATAPRLAPAGIEEGAAHRNRWCLAAHLRGKR